MDVEPAVRTNPLLRVVKIEPGKENDTNNKSDKEQSDQPGPVITSYKREQLFAEPVDAKAMAANAKAVFNAQRRAYNSTRLCREFNCPSQSYANRKGGLCALHGGGPICKYDGCSKRPFKGPNIGGFCKEHGGDGIPKKRCKNSPACSRWAINSKDYCTLCHNGDGGVPLRKPCLKEGCATLAEKNHDFCRQHGGYRRCKQDGCEKHPCKGGLCYAHGGYGRCKQDGCEKHMAVGGLCNAHYTSLWMK